MISKIFCKITGLIYSVFLFGIFLPVNLTAKSAFSIVDLGTLGGTYSYGAWINNSGEITGEAETTNGAIHAFLYRNGTMEDMSSANFGLLYSTGHGINNSNQVAGAYTLNGFTRGFISNGTNRTDVGTLGGDYCVAYSLNDAGNVVGESTTTVANGSQDHAFVRTNQTLRDLGTLGGSYSSAHGINKNKHVVGEAINATNSLHAFYYSSAPMVDLGTLGGNESSAAAINDSDVVVGYSTTAGGVSHAFRYSGGTMTDLGALGGIESSAYGINNSNQIVGYIILTTATKTNSHAFYFDGTTMSDLNDLIPTNSGWHELTVANAINDRGQITGYGSINGETHAFLLSPAATLSNPHRLLNGSFQFTINGSSGESWIVEGSTNFLTWTSLGTVNLVSPSSDFIDSNATNFVQRFYRVAAP